jgi:ribonuclease P protein component
VKHERRLKSNTDYKRVRQDGKVYSHPLVVLFTHENQLGYSRIGVAAGKSIGNAVTRNTIKRRLRAILHDIYTRVLPGWDILVIARRPSTEAEYQDLSKAVYSLLSRAGMTASIEL